jgi:hypothetical protein
MTDKLSDKQKFKLSFNWQQEATTIYFPQINSALIIAPKINYDIEEKDQQNFKIRRKYCLQDFMLANYTQVDHLFICKKFLKPIEIDNFKIKASNYSEKKKSERKCRIKNIHKPANGITTCIKDFEEIREPIVSSYYLHLLNALEEFLCIPLINPLEKFPFYSNHPICGISKNEDFYRIYDRVRDGSFFGISNHQ